MPELDHLESALGHHFKNRKLLFRALTHSSRVHEIQAAEPSGSDADNEQMEFLGDSVLGFLISESLVQRFPSYPEGRLSKLKAHLVSAAHLYEVAQALELGQYLILGRGEEMSGGRAKRTLLVDCLEALIAKDLRKIWRLEVSMQPRSRELFSSPYRVGQQPSTRLLM